MNPFAAAGNALLDLLPVYGYVVVAASVFAGAAGLPLPASVLLLAAGALSAEGVLDVLPIAAAALFAAVLGDCTGYALGRMAGRPLLLRAGARLRLPAGWLNSAEHAFDRWGGGAVWITRWLLTAAGPTVNLLAGAEAYTFRRFVTFAFVGEALWVGAYVGLGWLFGDNLDQLLILLEGVTWSAAAVIVAGVLALLAWRQLRSHSVEIPVSA